MRTLAGRLVAVTAALIVCLLLLVRDAQVPDGKSPEEFAVPILFFRYYYHAHPLARIRTPAPGVFAIDTHVHTHWSHDSPALPERILGQAAHRGLSAIAITDHNRFAGVAEVEAVAAALKRRKQIPAGFLVIPGEEVSSLQGHIGALFIDHLIPSCRSAAETVAAIHRQGGLAVAVHPYLRSGVGNLALTLPFDAIEVYNGAVLRTETVRRTEALARNPRIQRLAHLGASDSHYAYDVGSNYSLVAAGSLTLERVKAAIVAGRTTAMADPNNLCGYVQRHPDGLIGRLALGLEKDAADR